MRLTIASVGLFLLATLSTGSIADEIRKGATVQVKANSIWFQDLSKLAHWQELKKGGNSAALASYQGEVLSQRDAWQFISALTVKILRYKPRSNQVNVEMTESGRLEGTEWWLDADALVQSRTICPPVGLRSQACAPAAVHGIRGVGEGWRYLFTVRSDLQTGQTDSAHK